uniref:Uncharacterized protein n=1 Tax=Arundo donax TaxID=35708 RepID=A0A0A9BCM7_ARUDO
MYLFATYIAEIYRLLPYTLLKCICFVHIPY